MKEVEASARTLLEATSWMDWCSSLLGLQLWPTWQRRLNVTGFPHRAQILMMMAMPMLMLWANKVLKRCDVLLRKISNSITYEYKMEMRPFSTTWSSFWKQRRDWTGPQGRSSKKSHLLQRVVTSAIWTKAAVLLGISKSGFIHE